RERDLGRGAVDTLAAAYAYLRFVENRLQELEDRQTHALPTASDERARLAFAAGHADWNAFGEELTAQRRAVESEFERVAWDAHGPDAGSADAEGSASEAWETGAVGEALAGTPLAGNEEVEQLLLSLRTGALYQRMDELSRRRLSAVVLRTIPLLAAAGD